MLLHLDRFYWAGSATSQGFGLCGFDQTLAMRSFDSCAVKVELRKKDQKGVGHLVRRCCGLPFWLDLVGLSEQEQEQEQKSEQQQQ